MEQLLEKIETEIEAGYQRIKMKIKPGWDVDVVRQVREKFPQIKLMADANSAYTLADIDHLKKLDDFYLMMIEQPLAHDDIIDHAVLQAALQTPICLDECIRSAHHAEQAIRLKAAGSSILSWDAWAALAKLNACMTSARRTTFRFGAAACWNRALGGRITLPFPRCRILCCQATFPRVNAIGNGTLLCLRWKFLHRARLR